MKREKKNQYWKRFVFQVNHFDHLLLGHNKSAGMKLNNLNINTFRGQRGAEGEGNAELGSK